MDRCGFKMIKDPKVLNAISKKFGLVFDSKFKYEIGDAYTTKNGFSTNEIFKYKNRFFKLEYFSGCFYPFLIEVLK